MCHIGWPANVIPISVGDQCPPCTKKEKRLPLQLQLRLWTNKVLYLCIPSLSVLLQQLPEVHYISEVATSVLNKNPIRNCCLQ